MAVSDLEQLVARHRKYFLTGKTRPAEWREAQLAALQVLMAERAQDDASRSDLLAGATLGAASDKLVALKPIPARTPRSGRRWYRASGLPPAGAHGPPAELH